MRVRPTAANATMRVNIRMNPEAMRYLELCRVINKSGRALVLVIR